jgi:cell division protein FtsX
MAEEPKNEETQAEEVKDEAASETAAAAQTPADEKPLEKMTAPELKEIAGKIPGVTGVTAMKKEQLIALIREYRGISDEDAKKAESSRIGTLKKKIIDLKAAKAAAQEAKDKKEVDILRRRINRLKKMTRRTG